MHYHHLTKNFNLCQYTYFRYVHSVLTTYFIVCLNKLRELLCHWALILQTFYLFKKWFIYILYALIGVLAGYVCWVCWISCNWNYTQLWASMWVLGLWKSSQSLLSTAEPSFQQCLCSLSLIKTLFCGVWLYKVIFDIWKNMQMAM